MLDADALGGRIGDVEGARVEERAAELVGPGRLAQEVDPQIGADRPRGDATDLELHIRRIGLQEIVDDRAIRWILAGGFFRGKRRVGPGIAAIAIDVRRLKEEVRGERLPLTQRSNVVEYPERSAMRARSSSLTWLIAWSTFW